MWSNFHAKLTLNVKLSKYSTNPPNKAKTAPILNT